MSARAVPQAGISRGEFLARAGALSALAAFAGAGGLLLPAEEAGAANAYDALRLRWKEVLTGGTSYDPSDPDIANRISGIGSTARRYWDSMDKSSSRTYLWSDLASTTDSQHVSLNYNRLKAMALAYATKGSAYQNNAALAADVSGGLDWMYKNRYNEGKGTYANWYDWEIGAPLLLNDTVALVYERLSSGQITNYMNAVERFSPDVNSKTLGTTTGANRTSKCAVVGLRGVFTKDDSTLDGARDGLGDVFAYVEKGDGFYRDGSFIQHRAHPYTGAYGVVLLQIANLLYWLDGSAWEVTDPRKQNAYRWVSDSFEPLVYKGAMMDLVRGRAIARVTDQDHAAGHKTIQAIAWLLRTAPPADARAFKGMVKYWIQADTFRDFFKSMPIDMILIGKGITNDASVAPRGELVKHKQFPSMDCVAHLRPGFGFALRMSSSRVYNYESINGENTRGWYTADGMTYLYNGDLSHYSDDYWATVNRYRMPGTTVDTMPRYAGSGRNYLSPKSWAGGAELGGTYGIAGMELDAYGSTLGARKSWFMFDDEIVALGSGISSTDGRTIETIVENRKLNASGSNALIVDEAVKPASRGWSETMGGVRWAHLEGAGGYYFPDSATVKGFRQARTDSWQSMNAGGSTTPITRHYLSLWFDHGVSPSNKTYAYVLLPNATSGQTSGYAANPDVAVLENSASAQGVKEKTLNIVGVNFWEDAAKTVDIIRSNKKASVMTRESATEVEVSVSDPTQANGGDIEVEINRSAARTVSKDPEVTVERLSPRIKLKVNVSGASGKTFKVKLLKRTS